MMNDVRFGARLIAKEWSAALVIVVTLALATDPATALKRE